MKARLALFSLLAATALSPAAANAASAPGIVGAKPMFVTLPQHGQVKAHSPASQLTQWNGSFTDLTGQFITYTMVGNNPATSNSPATTPVYIIPIKMVYGRRNGNRTFDPNTHKVSNGKTVTANLIASPLFVSGIDFVQGGTDLGKTQYIDAFQRGNFWSSVQTNSNNHVLLGSPTVLTEQTISVSGSQGRVINNPFASGVVGTMDINAFDAKLQAYMRAFAQINPGVLPLFVTYDIYLTSGGGCCIGGYHSANAGQPGGQTYSYATYADPTAFSQDVSAFSHEIGEWVDDPFVDNLVNCTDNSLLEVGDPLEGNANYGGFPYTLNGFTYNLQSLVFLGYFGAPPSTSVHSWLSFQNDESNVCPGQ